MTEPTTATFFLPQERPRFRLVPLASPLSFGGQEYREIQVSRLTAKEVAEFQESIRTVPEGQPIVWPMFRDRDGAPLPEGFLDILDDDDSFELEKAARDFLPRRFLASPDKGSVPASGEATGFASAA